MYRRRNPTTQKIEKREANRNLAAAARRKTAHVDRRLALGKVGRDEPAIRSEPARLMWCMESFVS